ncbi:hypothetical protein [Roseibium aggregatum]|uniref:Uncharacterized protein n=1 Tax=Roseibium aggregatum TaxID=187304 RepID=A0A939EHV8_9HYPH|nr:hypothetical protein [Roseibium aggregatum]MBN9673486.1 hypothetical protein [Roseibium aggregatum]
MTDNSASPQAGNGSANNGGGYGDHSGHGQNGQPPHGWYYFGPQPPWAGGGQGPFGAAGGSAGDAGVQPDAEAGNQDLMDAFNRLSRGDLSAETLGKLFDLKDRDFWKGALLGSAAVLAVSNMPAIKALIASFTASAFSQNTPASETSKAGPVEEASEERQDDDS